jgi:hypothetical protein
MIVSIDHVASPHTDYARWQIPECQDLSFRGHFNVACRISHCATRRCTCIHLEDMSFAIKASYFKINVRALLSKGPKTSLPLIYMHQLLRFRRPHHIPSINSPRGITTKSPGADKPFEEECLPDYEPEQFYPVSIGDTVKSRYHVIGKLGFGANSTVWFCRDLSYGKDALLHIQWSQLTHHLETIIMLY